MHRIDVHHHLTPPRYVEALAPRGQLTPFTLSWTPEKALAQMDEGEVARSITSITTPGLWFGAASHTFTDMAGSFVKTGRVSKTL